MIAAEKLECVTPRNLSHALDLLADGAERNAPLTPLSGGTDLFVTLNAGAAKETRFLDLWSLKELRGLDSDKKNGRPFLTFGALTTYSECLASPDVEKHLPILCSAAREVGGPQIQNRGTLAGNIGNGSPAADAVPVLMAADTHVVLTSVNGERAIPLTEFYTGYRKTARRQYELITRIEVSVPAGKQVFQKVGTRAAQAISKVVMAAIGPQITFGSVGPTVVRLKRVEEYLRAGGKDLAEAQRLLRQEIRPIDDVRSTSEYRLKVAQNLLQLVV